MSKLHHYASRLSWTGRSEGPTATYASYSREYVVEIAGKPTLIGSADPTFRGDPSLHHPEDLLLASLSACHMLTYLAEAARAGLLVVDYEDAATGAMQVERGGGRFVEVVLRPIVTLAKGSDRTLAERLHEAAHAHCFIASSVNFPVRTEPVIRSADG